ncbi:MAG: Mismatch repair protein msh3 [Cirrosporium novae-zelandiae]|nr:MAG: Mismatch repair protein msh3 [Cirrosporium novae-zelandiae]
MPSNSKLGSQPSSQKKQQSISSFFGKASSATKPTPYLTPNPSINLKADRSNYSKDELLDATNHNGVSSNIRSSSQHSKREHQAEEDEQSGLKPPKAKRLRRRTTTTAEENDSDGNGNISRDEDISPPPDSHEKLKSKNGNEGKKPTITDRTSKYLFSSSIEKDENVEKDESSIKQKERLHNKFVKKLGRPESIAEIKRRNWVGPEDTTEDQAVEEEEDEPPPSKAKRGTAVKRGGHKLTPMEKQVLEIKRKHMDTVLVIEVGYKFRFFGEDARTAAKELSIVCIPGKFRYDEHPSEAHLDRFASASIPVHRLHVHVKRLVSAGHKVGVVRQLETAALKAASDNRNAPFVRKLTNLYTKGTYIDDVDGLKGPVDGTGAGTSASGHLLCITENNAKGWGTDEKVSVGIVAVQPATGDVIYDDFEDGFMRSEIETRLLHIAPCEFLIVGELSKATEKLVKHLSGSKTNVFGDQIRVERTKKSNTAAAESYNHVSNFYANRMKATGTKEDEIASNLLEKVLKLPENVTICLSAMINHLNEYGLEHVFDLTKYFQSFSARSHMLLNGTTLTSLEIYQNQTDYTETGSLFWTLNRTQTRFGRRLLRKWVGRPLLDRSKLEERVAAVEELKNKDQNPTVAKLKSLLLKTKSDLEKSLIRIYYGKCTRPELLTVLQTMQRIANEFAYIKSSADAGFESSTLNEAIAALPTIKDDVVSFLEKINPQAARGDDKYTFFRDNEETDEITEQKLGIAAVEQELDQHRNVAAEKLKKSKVEYVTVAGIEYLIEVPNDKTSLSKVPASWAKISGTKKVSRFHTPEVINLLRERDQHKEALAAACDVAFSALLSEISSKYQQFRDCIQSLATLDCLLSLAVIADQPGYVKPIYTNDTCIDVVQGRHPMVEQLLLDTYVPNNTSLSTDTTRALLVTGPNMGGKSSYVRQVALICIMGQIGSYVPAESARLGMLDAVLTRMGAFDNMMAGESTFMVELSETADILKQATSRSLVILDELGRGTSTHDGVAIAQAVLDYVVRNIKALTLFITHYQNLAALANAFSNNELKNVHMKFEETGADGQDITFLYEVGEGVAHRSYGLNVARLAGVPKPVLDVAAVKSRELEEEVKEKNFRRISGLMGEVLGGGGGGGDVDEGVLERLVEDVERL